MTNNILSVIDAEIAQLKQARKLLTDAPDVLPNLTKRRGRPKGSINKPAAPMKAKRTISAEGRERIAAAQKARWAAKKKADKKAAKAEATAE